MADIHIRYPLCIAAGAVFPPVASALVAMRFLARRQQSSKIGIDDWLTIPALVSSMDPRSVSSSANDSAGACPRDVYCGLNWYGKR